MRSWLLGGSELGAEGAAMRGSWVVLASAPESLCVLMPSLPPTQPAPQNPSLSERTPESVGLVVGFVCT